jgi:hypothetical protein
MKGIKKCNIKNFFNVDPLTEKSPHIQITNLFPKKGTAVTKFVITVAAQKLI